MKAKLSLLFALITLILPLVATSQEATVPTTPSGGGSGGGNTDQVPAFPESLPIGSFQMLKSWAREGVSHGALGFWAEDAAGKLNETSVEFEFTPGAPLEVINEALSNAAKKVKLGVSSADLKIRVYAHVNLRDKDWNWTFHDSKELDVVQQPGGEIRVSVNFQLRLSERINLKLPGVDYAYLRFKNENGQVIDTRSVYVRDDGTLEFPSAAAGFADLVISSSYRRNGEWVNERRIYGVDGKILSITPVQASATGNFANVIPLADNATEIAPVTDGKSVNPYTLFTVRYTQATVVKFQALRWENGTVASSRIFIRKIGAEDEWQEDDSIPGSGTIEPGEYHFFYDLNPADFPPNDEVKLPPNHWDEKG